MFMSAFSLLSYWMGSQDNYLLGCDQMCFATGLCFSEHYTASCQDPSNNLNVCVSIIKQIEIKNMCFAYPILGFSAFLQGYKKLWRNLFSIAALQEIICIQGKQEALSSHSIIFNVPHRFSEDVGQNRPWRHCVNNTLYNIICSVK